MQAAVKSTNPKFLDYALSKGLKPSKYVLTEKGIPLENVKKVIDSGASLEGEYDLMGSIFNYLIQSGGLKNLEVLAYYMEKYPETVAKIKLGKEAISKTLRSGNDVYGVYDFVVKQATPSPDYLDDAIYGGKVNTDIINNMLDAGVSPDKNSLSNAATELDLPDDLFYKIFDAVDMPNVNIINTLNRVLDKLQLNLRLLSDIRSVSSDKESNDQSNVVDRYEKRAGAIIDYIESHMKEIVASIKTVKNDNPVSYLRELDRSVQKNKMLSDEFKSKLYNCVFRLDTYSRKNESFYYQTNYYLED